MKKILLLLSAIVLSVFTLSSCTDWLDVSPQDAMLERDVYSQEASINAALNGLYTELVSSDLYGGNMTMSTVDFLAHYYDFDPTVKAGDNRDALYGQHDLGLYQYTSNNVTGRFTKIWDSSYKLIFRINEFIDNIHKVGTDVLPESRKNILIGEAYAMRAFVHFDIMRLFGPVEFTSPTPKLPYSNIAGVKLQTYITPEKYIDEVKADLEFALDYLKNDPIVIYGKRFDVLRNASNESTPSDKITDANGEDLFIVDMTPERQFSIKYRNRRLNYYAVKAIKARVLLANKEYSEALATAYEVLEKGTNHVYPSTLEEPKPFSFVKHGSGAAVTANQDFILYSEVLFGPENQNLHEKIWRSFFEKNKAGTDYVFYKANLYGNMLGKKIEEIDDNTYKTNDIRMVQFAETNFDVGATGENEDEDKAKYGTYVSYKFKPLGYNATNYKYVKNMQSLVRMSEMFYIMAEAHLVQQNTTEAAKAINEVLLHRGYEPDLGGGSTEGHTATLKEDAPADEIWTMLEREYYREFVYEGQAFYFKKRNKQAKMFYGYKIGSGKMAEDNYVSPIPKSETEYL